MPTTASSSRERVRSHRARQRARGLRPVTYWLPDTTSLAFLTQAAAEARAVAAAAGEDEVMEFIAELQDWPADEAVFWRKAEKDEP